MTAIRRPLALLAVLAVLLAACTGGPTADPTPDPQERIEAIRAARAVALVPVQDLGTQAAATVAWLDQAADAPAEQVLEQLRGSITDLADARADLADAVDLVQETVPQTDDVQAAQDAMERMVEAAEELGEAAQEVVEGLEALLAGIPVLEEVTGGWNQPGSQSQLTARFQESAAVAEALAEEIQGPDTCAGPAERIADAAAFVAEATSELEALVRAGSGTRFDERRGELSQAPYGLDGDQAVNLRASVDRDACPAVGDAQDAAEALLGALEDLEEALNPADLLG
jgi:hypothetical protein